MSTTSLLREERERLYYTPVLDPSNDGKQDVLIYMLPGNPGLITYYQPFLSTLHTLLQSSPASQNANFYVCGYSFAGFETLPAEDEQSAEYPLRLRDLIKDTNDRLYSHIETHRSSHAAHERSLKVILMGHSVGAYILLELIQRHKENIDKGKEDFDLIGGILLFPTITHIAQSRSGMIASNLTYHLLQTLLKIPHAALIGGAIVRCLFFLVPTAVLYNIIRLVMRFPEHAARTTTQFIKSQMGVRQALHLAKDEMEFITDDNWDAEVWGTAHSPITNEMDTARWNLIFYWGKNDRWVADHTRDSIIKDRSSRVATEPEGSKPSMLIDPLGIPHAFVLKHSEVVAAMAKGWVEEIIQKHETASKS